MHDDLHWLDVADRVTYKLGVIMHRCRHGKAPQYLFDCCTPVTDVVGRQRLRSATQQMMVVPRHWLSTVGRRAFAVQGPQDYESFRQRPKTWLFLSCSCAQCIRDFVTIVLYNFTVTSTITIYHYSSYRRLHIGCLVTVL